jgi:hypothetical protein
MLARFKEGEIGDSTHVAQTDLCERVVYRCVIGSQAYGVRLSAPRCRRPIPATILGRRNTIRRRRAGSRSGPNDATVQIGTPTLPGAEHFPSMKKPAAGITCHGPLATRQAR